LFQKPFEIFFPILRSNKIFDFHLFELAHAKYKVARRDLVAKRFADLRDAEREFWMEGIKNIFKVRKNPLSRLGAQIGDSRLILARAYLRLEHHVEAHDWPKRVALGAFDAFL